MALDEIKSVDDILALYRNYGRNDYIGEKVTQVEHAIQAALCAQGDGHDEEEVCGALLHDIGHLIGAKYAGHEHMGEFGVRGHENLGSQLLRKLHFSEKVCDLVESHVDAKRYLVSSDEQYYESLSIASKMTFKYQGGKMTDEEVKAFRAKPNFEAILRVRTYDDRAKVENMELPSFDSFRDLLLRCSTRA